MNMRLAVSSGDVNGIGLRCFADACSHVEFNASIELLIDASTLVDAISAYRMPGIVVDSVWHVGENNISIVPISAATCVTPGVITERCFEVCYCILGECNRACCIRCRRCTRNTPNQ